MRGWPALGLTLAFTLTLWAISMQHRPPFSTGQTLGSGFLIGGITGMVAAVFTLRFGIECSASLRLRQLAVLPSLFTVLCGASLAYLIFSGNPQDALLGFSIGIVMAAILNSTPMHSGLSIIQTEGWAIFGVTLTAGVLLAVKHFDQSSMRMWWALPILLASSVLIACYVGIEIASLGRLKERQGLSCFVAVLISAVLVAGLSAIYSWRIVESWQLLEVVAVGIGVAAVIAWLAAGLDQHRGIVSGTEVGASSVLLLIGFTTVAFKLWSGLGVALGLLGMWSVAAPVLAFRSDARDEAEHADTAPMAMLGALTLGLVIVLFRLFVQQYRPDVGSTDIRIHYTFVGALLGAVLPFVFVSYIARLHGAPGSAKALASVVFIGLLAAVAPVLLFLVWEIKAVLGFCFGITAAMAFLLLMRTSEDGRRFDYSAGLLSMGAMLAAIQFVGPLASLDLTRIWRVIILAGAAVLFIAVIGIGGAVAARKSQ